MKIHYKDSNFVQRTLNNNNVAISKAKVVIAESEKTIKSVGEKLYDQFRSFAFENEDLYDADFVDLLRRSRFEVKEATIVSVKKAIRLSVNITPYGIKYVMVPILFLNDPQAYKMSRKRKLTFGKGATASDVRKHYDGEIGKLQAEIERLKQEKGSMADDLWS